MVSDLLQVGQQLLDREEFPVAVGVDHVVQDVVRDVAEAVAHAATRCARHLQLSPKSSVAHRPLFPSQRETKSQSRQDTLSRAPHVHVEPKLDFGCELGRAKVGLWL